MGMESRVSRHRALRCTLAIVASTLACSGVADAATLSVASVNESAGTATVTITRSGLETLSGQSFALRTESETAVAPDDFAAVPSPATIQFSAFETSRSATIAIVDDLSDEDAETFKVFAEGSSAVTGSPATVTITDNDDPPVLAIRDASGAEGNGGTSNKIAFTVDVSIPSAKQITVNWRTLADTGAAAPASFPGDLAAQSGVLTIPAGSASATLTVNVTHDRLDEPDETFRVALEEPIVNARLAGNGARDTAVGRIVNDDTPLLAAENVSIAEGNAGTTNLDFQVLLSNPSTKTITVDFATGDFAGTDPAQADVDYIPVSGTLTWAPGDTAAKVVAVPIRGDVLPEENEVFVLNFANAVGAIALPAALGGILNDDGGKVTSAPAGNGTGSGFVPTDLTNRAKPKVSGVRSRKAGELRVRVSCPASSTVCKGKLTVLTAVSAKSRFKVLRREQTVRTLTVSLTRGKSKTYKIRASKALKRKFKGIKKVKVGAYAILRDVTGTADAVRGLGTFRLR